MFPHVNSDCFIFVVFLIVAIKWKMIFADIVICFLYVCYSYHAPCFLYYFFKGDFDNVRACVRVWLCVCVCVCMCV